MDSSLQLTHLKLTSRFLPFTMPENTLGKDKKKIHSNQVNFF